MARLRILLFFLLPLALAGCGYSFGGGNQSVLAPQYKKLAVDEVTNPTSMSWLEPRVRRLLRDELNNRGQITWVDNKAKADAVITITILRYYRPTSVAGESDETLQSTAIFRFKATIRSTMDNSILWESGKINQNWPFFTGQEDEADKQVTLLGIRRLADRMSQNY